MAGKTGTTQDNGDAWFVGFVPQLSTAVWVGYEPHRPMYRVHGRAVFGGSFPATIFAHVMRRALEGVPVEPIPTADPDDLDLRRIRKSTPSVRRPRTPTPSNGPTTAAPANEAEADGASAPSDSTAGKQPPPDDERPQPLLPLPAPGRP